MNRKQLVLASMIVIVAVLAFVFVSSVALAQKPGPASNGYVAPLPGEKNDPLALQSSEVPGASSEDSQPREFPKQDAPQPDENQPGAPGIAFTYYHVAGAALQPRASSTSYAYDGLGCIHITAGAELFNTNFQVPDGSTIKYLRLYYYDTSATDEQAWITRYDDGASFQDLVTVASTGSSGLGTILSPAITHTVDNYGWSYVLNWRENTTGATLQLCGLRVAYYAPIGMIQLLPSILHNAHP
jgi:hypothetical protein